MNVLCLGAFFNDQKIHSYSRLGLLFSFVSKCYSLKWLEMAYSKCGLLFFFILCNGNIKVCGNSVIPILPDCKMLDWHHKDIRTSVTAGCATNETLPPTNGIEKMDLASRTQTGQPRPTLDCNNTTLRKVPPLKHSEERWEYLNLFRLYTLLSCWSV